MMLKLNLNKFQNNYSKLNIKTFGLLRPKEKSVLTNTNWKSIDHPA